MSELTGGHDFGPVAKRGKGDWGERLGRSWLGMGMGPAHEARFNAAQRHGQRASGACGCLYTLRDA